MANIEFVDITPTPRILRMLGEIPYLPWQCIAELIDNSIDAFIKAKTDGIKLNDCEITVNWSSNLVAVNDRAVEVSDNAQGMTLEQMQNAVRAGYTSNDPVGNLGLFGMGFNIATARLGSVTEIETTRKGDLEWVGLRLDFDDLQGSKKYNVPVYTKPKANIDEHGTRIVVSRLKPGIAEKLPTSDREIRSTLQNVYSSILSDYDIKIRVRGKILQPVRPCIWDESRYIIKNGNKVNAVIRIDKSFGFSYFDTFRNGYLSADENTEMEIAEEAGETLPANIIKRDRRVTGWLGIQRYADPDDYGIDFIRNGRKILRSDKTFFSYNNRYDGTKYLQYPTNLGSTTGGRIVGELNVDFLIPTYEKNDFDRADLSWRQLEEYICGIGPYRALQRKAMGFTEKVEAPLAILATAYDRADPGTKCLFVPNAVSKAMVRSFKSGVPEYLDDTKWYKAAQEEDQKRASGSKNDSTEVNPGSSLTDDIDDYVNNGTSGDEKPTKSQGTQIGNENGSTKGVQTEAVTSKIEDLIAKSDKMVTLSGKYNFGAVSPYEVTAYELKKGDIRYNGISRPTFFDNVGINCTYVYNPRHAIFKQYPLSPKGLLLQYLAEKVKAREPGKFPDIVDVYTQFVIEKMPDAKIDKAALQEKAGSFFDRLRENMIMAFRNHELEAIECIHEATGDVEETIGAILSRNDLIKSFQEKQPESIAVLEYVPPRALVRLVERFPELIFDGKVFKSIYLGINLVDQKTTERTRNEAKDRMISFVKDAARVVTLTSGLSKNELSRIQISLDVLLGELV